MEDNLYCKIFLDFNGTTIELVKLITKLADGVKKRGNSVESSCLSIDIEENEAFNTPKARRSADPGDMFLYWRYYLDIEPIEMDSRTTYIFALSTLIHDLWTNGVDTVAASEFEEELPRR